MHLFLRPANVRRLPSSFPMNEHTYALQGILGYLTPITENQVENRMDNEMEAGLVCWLIRLRISQS